MLRLHRGLLSAQAYLVPVLTGLREGRGEPYRQCHSKTARNTFTTIPLKGLMSLYFSFLSLPPRRGHDLPACGQTKAAPLVPRGLTDNGLTPVLTNRHSTTLQGHACYPPINKDGRETGGEGGDKAVRSPSAAVLASTMTTTPPVPADKGVPAAGRATSSTSRGISRTLYLCHSK